MLERVNHIALAVPDLLKAMQNYQYILGAKLSEPQPLPEHGVTVVFIELENTKVELLEPLGDHSPIAEFLQKFPDGGMHHICYEVSDINRARDTLVKEGARILGDGTPKLGAHDRPVLFLHPKDFHGCLIELEEVR